MLLHVRLVSILALLAILYTPRLASGATSHRADDIRALDGEWIYVEDRTQGRPVEEQQPSMGGKVRLRVEDDAVVLIRSDGEIRIPLDGSATDITREGRVSRYRGQWKDGAFFYESEPVGSNGALIQWELRHTDEGLIASVQAGPNWQSVALYRHPQDIPLPEPARATANDLAWLTGAWVGSRGSGGAISMEERWSPPRGGALLGLSRTVSRDRMVAFEFLRIVQRDGSLIYIAQPNGAAATEFILTEISDSRAVFINPRHDSPQRIIYERAADGGLTAAIGFANGGRPRRFDFKPESP